MFRKLLPILCLALVFAQDRTSIHQAELEWHKANFLEPAYKPYIGPAHPKQSRMVSPSKKVFGYHPYWQGTLWKNYNYDLLTTIAYFSAEATATGGLSDLHGWPVTDLINKAHDNGVNVVLTVNLFNKSALETLLGNAGNRQQLIDNLLYQVKRANADGVNVDFEAFPASQKANMVTFITDLTQTFHDSIPGSQVTLAMPAVDWNAAWNYKALASASDGLVIMGYDYHWSGSSTTGPVAPLTGGTYNVTNTINDYLTKTGNQANKLILGCPYYGYEWGANSGDPGAGTTTNGSAVIFSVAEAKALSFGKLWDDDSKTPWYRYQNPGWYQGWYDDSTSLSLKYDLAINKDLGGVGMWALGYDQGYTELWEALQTKFGAPTTPSSPQQMSVINAGDGTILIDFTGAESAASFSVKRIFLDSADTEEIGTFTSRPIIIQGLASEDIYFLKIRAHNELGDSPETEVLGTVPGEESRILVVNGFDRISGTNNSYDFIRQHGSAIYAAGFGFDAASNEAIINGRIKLTDYKMVDWILGEEATATGTFTGQEQELVQAYLESGGRLFISGSEVGYDLSDKGTVTDQLFYEKYLKAIYLSDAAAGRQGTYSAQGATDSFLEGITVNFDDGTQGTYDVDWPDGIHPTDGAEIILKYAGVDYNSEGGAGIAYRGWFGNAFITGALVYLAVGFETIYPEATRNELMVRILDYLEGPTTALKDEGNKLPGTLSISAIYPNPSNSAVTIEFHVPNGAVSIFTITDLRGRQIFRMQIHPLKTRIQKIRWNGLLSDGREAPSGVYLANLRQGRRLQTKKFTLLK